MHNITVLKHIYPAKGDDVFLILNSKQYGKEVYCIHIPYYTLAIITIKSSGVLFIPLHAEHVYNEGHGVPMTSHISFL